MDTFEGRAYLTALVAALALSVVAVWPALERAATADSATSYYVFLYKPGRAWPPGKPITELPLETHFAYMAELQRKQVLVLGGPFEDGDGAMGIILAASREDAVRIVSADPLVRDGVVVAEVRPWHAAVAGCAESKPFRLVPRSR